MKIDLHNYVDMRADFHRPAAIDQPTGGELAAILAAGIAQRDIRVTKTEAVDFANYVECEVGTSSIELMVGAEFLNGANDRWYVQPLAKRTFFGTKEVSENDYRELLLALDDVLKNCDRVSDIRWYPSFDTPEYLALMPRSDGPIPEPSYFDNLHPLIWIYWRLNQIIEFLESPIGFWGFVILACILLGAIPQFGMYIVTLLFFTSLAMMTVVPLVLSIFVSREAKRLAKCNRG